MLIYQHTYDYAIGVSIWDIVGILFILGIVYLWAKQKIVGSN